MFVLRLFGPLVLMLALVAGCGPENVSKPKEGSPIKKLAILYGQFTGRHRGQPPKDENEFKEYYATAGKASLESHKVASLESLMTSPRDGKPYVIIYGVPKGPPGPAGAPVVMYEQEGVNGMRYVASSLGAVEEVDEATFKRYVP